VKSHIKKIAAIFGCLLAFISMSGAAMLHAQGVVVAETVPSDPTPAQGATITVDINIDVSGTDPAKLLGSFTGSLKWDRELIQYVGYDGVKAPFTGVVNVMNAGAIGAILFNGANAAGAAGKSNVLTVTFTATSPNGLNVALDLEFTAMLAALDFTDLMPLLTVNDGSITTAIAGGNQDAALPKDFALGQNFPNPFNPETEISYELPRQSQVVLTVFNLIGQKVNTLVNSKAMPGRHTIRWHGTDDAGRRLSSGVYLYRLEAEDRIFVRKMVLLQ
jgi:hypothetical protein